MVKYIHIFIYFFSFLVTWMLFLTLAEFVESLAFLAGLSELLIAIWIIAGLFLLWKHIVYDTHRDFKRKAIAENDFFLHKNKKVATGSYLDRGTNDIHLRSPDFLKYSGQEWVVSEQFIPIKPNYGSPEKKIPFHKIQNPAVSNNKLTVFDSKGKKYSIICEISDLYLKLALNRFSDEKVTLPRDIYNRIYIVD